MESEKVKLAREYATAKHLDQFRRDGVTPYIEHPKAVADLVDGDGIKIVAWLHDVLEDTDATVEELGQMFSAHLVRAVIDITHIEGESYEDYLSRVKNSPLAKQVKIKDILVNLNDDPSKNQVKKYSKALLFLLDERDGV